MWRGMGSGWRRSGRSHKGSGVFGGITLWKIDRLLPPKTPDPFPLGLVLGKKGRLVGANDKSKGVLSTEYWVLSSMSMKRFIWSFVFLAIAGGVRRPRA